MFNMVMVKGKFDLLITGDSKRVNKWKIMKGLLIDVQHNKIK